MGGRDGISSHQQSPENLASKYKVGVTTGQEGAEGSGGRPRKGDGERRVRASYREPASPGCGICEQSPKKKALTCQGHFKCEPDNEPGTLCSWTDTQPALDDQVWSEPGEATPHSALPISRSVA